MDSPRNLHELWMTLVSKGMVEESNFVAGLEAQQLRVLKTLQLISNGHPDPVTLAKEQIRDITFK